jgi:hypothetical protein
MSLLMNSEKWFYFISDSIIIQKGEMMNLFASSTYREFVALMTKYFVKGNKNLSGKVKAKTLCSRI